MWSYHLKNEERERERRQWSSEHGKTDIAGRLCKWIGLWRNREQCCTGTCVFSPACTFTIVGTIEQASDAIEDFICSRETRCCRSRSSFFFPGDHSTRGIRRLPPACGHSEGGEWRKINTLISSFIPKWSLAATASRRIRRFPLAHTHSTANRSYASHLTCATFLSARYRLILRKTFCVICLKSGSCVGSLLLETDPLTRRMPFWLRSHI